MKEKLDGSVLTNALEIVAYLAANDIYPDPDMFNAFLNLPVILYLHRFW
jgi:hypothetical protein